MTINNNVRVRVHERWSSKDFLTHFENNYFHII